MFEKYLQEIGLNEKEAAMDEIRAWAE